MLLALWIACFLLSFRQAQGIIAFSLDGTRRYAVSLASCTCSVCNGSTSVYVRKFGSSDYENVGMGKTVTSSTLQTAFRCAATNGLIDSLGGMVYLCLKTSSEDFLPWVEIDLAMVFTVAEFYLSGSKMNRQASGDHALFKGMDVLVDGIVVKQFPTYTAPWSDTPEDIDFPITLNSPRTFRYIRLEKRDEPNKGEQYYIKLCDVKIWVCPPGYYSKSTSDPCIRCPDDCDYLCDNYHGCLLVKHNVAIKKSTTQGGTFKGDSNKIVDGIPPVGSAAVNCVMIDNWGETAWWRVDLSRAFKVYDIEVTPRTDCCGPDSLKDFSIYVTMEDAMPTDYDQLCHFYTGDVATKVVIKVSCKTPLVGRYIWVTRKDALHFCELEAFGHTFMHLYPRSRCFVDSSFLGCFSDHVCVDRRCKPRPLAACSEIVECAGSNICEAQKCRINYLESCGNNTDACVLTAFCDSDAVCKVRNGHKCREPTATCSKNSVCDNFKRCGIKPGLQCRRTDECSAGATCLEGKCWCILHFTKLNNDRCEPVQGRITTQCSSNSDCNVGECQNNACTCVEPLIPSPIDFSCKRKVQSDCASQDDCSSGLICLNEKCYLKAGQNCFGNEEYCAAGTVCVDDICSYQPGQNCTDMGELCIADSTCSSGICKLLLGKSCIKFKEHCQIGFCSVQDNSTCRFNTRHKCTWETAKFCHAGSLCEDALCKLKTREVCTGSEQCLRGNICNQVQGSANKECRIDFGNNCQEDDQCVAGSVCDLLESCRIPSGGNCTDHPDMCVHGSWCTSQGQCLCNQNVTDSTTSKCKPKAGQVGGSCLPTENSNALPCESAGAKCNLNLTCKCDENFIPDLVTLQCRAAPGTVCTIPCVEGSVCENSKCALDVGSSCSGENRGYCRMGTVCDPNICRLDFRYGCEANLASLCRNGSVCDLMNICRRPLKGLCREMEDCIAGAECKQGLCDCTKGVTERTGDQCVPLKGLVFSSCETDADCTVASSYCNPDSKRCNCQKGYLVHPGNLTCAKGFEQKCVKNDECAPGMICDPVIKKCRIGLGYMCDEGKEKFCMSGAICDFDFICRLDLKVNCSGERRDYCKSDTFCDVLKQCGIGVGGYCSETELEDSCVAGAKCIQNFCTCDLELSSEFGAICEPISGRYGGTCTESGTCKVINSDCVDGICKCKPPFSPDRYFGCGPVAFGILVNLVILFFILLGILVLAVIILVCCVIRRCRRRAEAQQKLMEHRGQSLMQLNTLREEVEQVNLQAESQSLEPSMEQSSMESSSAATESTVQSLASSTATGFDEKTSVVA